MTHLLHIDSSILGANSISRQLTAQIVAVWRRAHPDVTIDYLDLAVDGPSHFDSNSIGSKTGAQAVPTEIQRRENAVSEKLVSQFLAADVVVIGAPLYNFTIPTQLKSWIDRLAQPGRTFKYTEKGPIGLATNKTVFVAITRGGMYSNSEAGQATEHQESYLKVVLGFFGVTDIRFVRAEGLALGVAPKAAAIDLARQQIEGYLTDGATMLSSKPANEAETAPAC